MKTYGTKYKFKSYVITRSIYLKQLTLSSYLMPNQMQSDDGGYLRPTALDAAAKLGSSDEDEAKAMIDNRDDSNKCNDVQLQEIK